MAESYKILKGERLLPGIAQDRRGVERPHHEKIAALKEFAVLLCHFKIWGDQVLGRNPAEADQDFGMDQFNLLAEIADAFGNLVRSRVPVFGGRHLTILAI